MSLLYLWLQKYIYIYTVCSKCIEIQNKLYLVSSFVWQSVPLSMSLPAAGLAALSGDGLGGGSAASAFGVDD